MTTLARTVGLGSLAGLTYAVYETQRLVRLYPMHHDSIAPAATAGLWPKGLCAAVEVRARTRLPPGVTGADMREALVQAFYQAWTLRLEGWSARTFRQAAGPAPDLTDATPRNDPRLPAAYASGLFRVLGRSETSTMVWWGDLEMGGAQLITCLPSDGGVQVAYTCAETPFIKDGIVGRLETAVHQMYMRFLVDRAAQRLEKWTRRADQHGSFERQAA